MGTRHSKDCVEHRNTGFQRNLENGLVSPQFTVEIENWKESQVLRDSCPVSNRVNEFKQKHAYICMYVCVCVCVCVCIIHVYR